VLHTRLGEPGRTVEKQKISRKAAKNGKFTEDHKGHKDGFFKQEDSKGSKGKRPECSSGAVRQVLGSAPSCPGSSSAN
jgi:hypothetical protein